MEAILIVIMLTVSLSFRPRAWLLFIQLIDIKRKSISSVPQELPIVDYWVAALLLRRKNAPKLHTASHALPPSILLPAWALRLLIIAQQHTPSGRAKALF